MAAENSPAAAAPAGERRFNEAAAHGRGKRLESGPDGSRTALQ